MYGLVNRTVEDLVVFNYGRETWQALRSRAPVGIETFLSMVARSDGAIEPLIVAASEVLGLSPDQALEHFGEYFAIFSATESDGEVMEIAGGSFVDYLASLDAVCAPVGLRLSLSDITDDSLRLSCRGARPRMAPLVVGVVRGVGRLFDTEVDVRWEAAGDALVVHYRAV